MAAAAAEVPFDQQTSGEGKAPWKKGKEQSKERAKESAVVVGHFRREARTNLTQRGGSAGLLKRRLSTGGRPGAG